MKHKLTSMGVAAAAVLGLMASAANADIYIGLQQDAGPIVTVASGPTPLLPLVFAGAFGDFEGEFGQPGTTPPILLSAGSIAVNNAGGDAGTLSVYVTSTDNTAPIGSVDFLSGFATVDLQPPTTETLETYIGPGNGVFELGTLLGSAFFTGVDAELDLANASTGAGPYSVTAVLRFTMPAHGTAIAQAGIAGALAVPEPGSLALLASALAGLGIFARRRRRAAV